jgi:hypothetical protein
MADSESVNNPKENGAADRRTFLSVLYGSRPDNHYLELRCIHPVTGEVRVLWSKSGGKRGGLTPTLKQADKLNAEGFGVYFAPCLRRTKSGSADAAAWMPALWIDIDSTPDDRQRDYDRLRAFDPAPSFILDSGGGWHAYWLLDEPLALQDDADRQNIASLLRGLFAALGGDPGYVKSVASVMRLPDSINTKPERGGAAVRIVESHPDRRYPLTAFPREAVDLPFEPSERILKLPSLEYGPAPLPARTEQYLLSGATGGKRNAELFAAACQIRDSGQTQADVEHALIPRYVADGGSAENRAAREKEARATIQSAFSRPPRDPIPTSPRDRVTAIVQRYKRDEPQDDDQERVEEISETIRECAKLDPVEWAAERKRLKAICGDELRLADLDRMYREARREHAKAQQLAEAASAEEYVEIDGAMVHIKQSHRGTYHQVVADWVGRVTEWVTRTNDEEETEHVMRLRLQHGDRITTIDVPSELFGDAKALQRFIAQKAGGTYVVRAGMSAHLVSAILKLSGDPDQRQTFGLIGWACYQGKWAYVSPGLCVNTDGVLASQPEVELEARLRDYRLTVSDWQAGAAAFQSVIEVFPQEHMAALTSFTLLPLFQRFFPAAAPKPALHLVGTTGSGKSEIASLMASFYGNFSRDTPPGQWGDTINTVELLGYSLADALFWVDDYKQVYADERTFTRFLQSYSRGMGRGRLTREAKLKQDRPCRGLLLSTGETTIEGEASVLSRMLVIEIPPWEQRDPSGQALQAAESLRNHLTAFTGRLIQWIAAQADAGTLNDVLAFHFAANVQIFRQKLATKLDRQANTGRMIGNWAVLLTVYQMLGEFWQAMGISQPLKPWQDSIFETIERVQQQRASDAFIQAVNELLASGEAAIQPLKAPEEPRNGVTIIGYEDEQYIYLLPDTTHRLVSRISPLKFSTNAIGSQLKEEGWLTAESETRLAVQIKVRDRRPRAWCLKSDLFSGVNRESGVNPVETQHEY